MKSKLPWTFTLVPFFLLASAALYLAQFLVLGDARHIIDNLLGNLAFLFIYVLVVILIIENLLERREKKSMMKKMNMVIGTFFSEVGLDLLRRFTLFVQNAEDLKAETDISPHWSKKDFERARLAAQRFPYRIQVRPEMLAGLRAFLLSKHPFLLGLLENPNLLEHERFTDLLWAVFHLAEELAYRDEKLASLPQADAQHLAGDLLRAYSQIVGEWISYTQHLKDSYPFLFSLASRINPLGRHPTAIIGQTPSGS